LTSTENTDVKTEDIWDITPRRLAVTEVSDGYSSIFSVLQSTPHFLDC